MTAPISPFEPGPSLARVAAVDGGGYRIDTRGPNAARAYRLATAGDAAELALVLHDTGWRLRFGEGAEAVRDLVADLSEGGAA